MISGFRGLFRGRADNIRSSPKYRRQPSPPFPQPQLQQFPSQAEVAVINSTNLFDPFLDNDSSSHPSIPPSPTRSSPTHSQQPPTPQVHSEAIPVPATQRRQSPNISRSDPLPSTIRHRPRPISARPSTYQHFPICDDMNDPADSTTRPHYDNGLQTAPISTRTPGAFPFNTVDVPPSPSPVSTKRRNRKHHRTPSEGVFHMSSDEDISSGPREGVLNPNVRALFGLVSTFNPSPNISSSVFSTPVRPIPPYKRVSVSPSNGSLTSKEKQLEREAAEKAAGYFASSMFQNSPSPDELPDPLLL